MSRLHALLATVALSTVCAGVGTTAAVAATGDRHAAVVTPVARTAREAGRQAAHAHKSCGAKRRARHHGHSRHCTSRHNRRLDAKRARHTTPKKATTVTLSTVPTIAATIASVLSSPCENTELTPEAGNIEAVETATLCLINQERARAEELPLQPSAQLAHAAERHSEAMVGEDYFAHIAPDGETPLDRVRASGYIPNSDVGYTLGENLAWGTLYLATPSSIVAAWIASPEHLANILTADYRQTAIAIVPSAPPSLAEGQSGAVYTQEFGVVQD